MKFRLFSCIDTLAHMQFQFAPEFSNCIHSYFRNLSYGRQNDENKRAIKNAGGITALVR